MTESKYTPKIWSCKIGEVHPEALADGADAPMRTAVRHAFIVVTGQEPLFIFSGWGAQLDETERAVVENRPPSDEHWRRWHAEQAALLMLDALKRLDPQCITTPPCGSCVGCDALATITKAEGRTP
jgi:hypothetical protein